MLVQHLRLGYIHLRKLATIAKKGIIIILGDRQLYCIVCLIAQSHQVYSRILSVRLLLVYYLVSVDVVYVRQPSLTKDRNFILFIEGKALKREAYFSAYKGAAAVYLKTYYLQRRNASYLVVIFRIDGGKEYRGNALLVFAAENSIRLQVTPPYTSTKNSLAEVSNYIVYILARKMMIYANLPSTLQAEAVGTAVYVLNLIPSDTLEGDFLRHIIDIALGRAINVKKPMLNTLRAYGATTIVYDYNVPRRSKFEGRGQREQLVGYEDSMYRIWIASLHKVVRLPYCQFIETGELAEILGTATDQDEEYNQQFENIVVESRGKPLQVPKGYKIETIKDDGISEDYKNFVPASIDPTAERDAIDTIDATTRPIDSLPVLGQDAPDNTEVLDGYKEARPSLLDLLVDETLLRSSRSCTKTTKLRANYTITKMPIETAKALTVAVTSNELGIIILKSLKESQQLPEAKQQMKAVYTKFRMYIKNHTQRNQLRNRIGKHKVLRRRQIFTVKRGPDRTFSRFKARQVVRSFT